MLLFFSRERICPKRAVSRATGPLTKNIEIREMREAAICLQGKQTANLGFCTFARKKISVLLHTLVSASPAEISGCGRLNYEGNDRSFRTGVMGKFCCQFRDYFFRKSISFCLFLRSIIFRSVAIFAFKCFAPFEPHETEISST